VSSRDVLKRCALASRRWRVAPAGNPTSNTHSQRNGCSDGHDRQQRDRQRDCRDRYSGDERRGRFLDGIHEPQPAPHKIPRDDEAADECGGCYRESKQHGVLL
jgi:hypothetical protein